MEQVTRLNTLSSRPDLSRYSFDYLLRKLEADRFVQPQSQADLCQLDPRDGTIVVYAEHRALRQDEHADTIKKKASLCPICQGQLTEVIDVADLSDGFTFISQNRFPVVYPANNQLKQTSRHSLYPDPHHLGRYAYGFHLLQWSSSVHKHDWHNMPISDVSIGMRRLANLEAKLLRESSGYMPVSDQHKHLYGYVSIIKNYGSAAGASLTHGHQQVAFSNIMPQRTYNNLRFYQRHQVTFSQFLLRENPASLTVAEIGRTRIIVPYFMRRPFNLLVVPQSAAEHLHELNPTEFQELELAIQKTMQVYHRLLASLNRDVSFNMAIHTGPDSQLYVEFFPMVQAMGGFERIGMWICQLSAQKAADRLRALFEVNIDAEHEENMPNF
jgi:galactose-1-phosphate uridylyltransferase